MSASLEQREFNFGETKPRKTEVVEVKVEDDKDKECGACGNLLAGRSSCPQCMNNTIKKNWKNEHPQKTKH